MGSLLVVAVCTKAACCTRCINECYHCLQTALQCMSSVLLKCQSSFMSFLL